MGFKNLVFKVFFTKQTENFKSRNFSLKKNLKNPRFRLTVTAENCFLSVSSVVLVATLITL